MQPIATDGVSWSVSMSLGCHREILAKMSEQIKMSFGKVTRVGQRNHELLGVQIPKGDGALYGGCPTH